MRVTRGFSRLLDLEGIWVRRVEFLADGVVWVALRRRRLICPLSRIRRRTATTSGGRVELAASRSRDLAA